MAEQLTNLDDLSPLALAPFDAVVNSFEQLVSQSDRAFLIGAGCSKCAGLPLTTELTDLVVHKISGTTKEILERLVADFAGADSATIEEFMSDLVDKIAIGSRRVEQGATQAGTMIGGKQFAVEELARALDEIKEAIADCIEQKTVDIGTHWRFIRAVHRVLRTGKRSALRPVDYLVLNYDSLIEDALALECLMYGDGFSGGATGWWDTSSYFEDNLAARVLKLHGSIDWSLFEDEVNPRRLRGGLNQSANIPRKRLLIWPAATKYRETERDPFAQIAKIMREALRPNVNSYVVLTICGYRFGDSHINAELHAALRESKKRLTLLVFTGDDQPQGILRLWHENPDLRDQVRIHAKKGFFHTSDTLSNVDLPWWKFEVLARLLGGER
jgi:SIR2-like protein